MPRVHRHQEERADLVCKNCQFPQMRRVRRQGWLEREFYPHFGFYPWECIDCRQITMHKMRTAPGKTPESRHSGDQHNSPSELSAVHSEVMDAPPK
jgi:hypothetical protein